MHSSIVEALSLSPKIAYALIFLFMLFEGDIVVFTAFFLVHQGALPFWGTLGAVLAGLALGDVVWFLLGKKPEEHSPLINKIHTYVEKITHRFDPHLEKHTLRTIFLSKFAYGLHHIIILRAGMRDMHIKTFLWCDARASLLWLVIVGGLGYLSSASFSLIGKNLRFAELGFLAFLILFIGFEKIVTRALKNRL